MPSALSVAVHEESDTTAHLVLPPRSNLSESDLRTVAGGWKRISLDTNDW